MWEDKRTLIWNVASTLGVTFTIPYIVYRICRAIYVKRVYGSLSGKVVVITGASSGLGEALAHEFYKHGCQIVLCARRRQELDRVRQDLLKTHPTVPIHHPIIVPLDLADTESLTDAAEKILALTGHVDILINNGGISTRGSVEKTRLDVDLQVMQVNYFGAVALLKAFLPGMKRRRQGHVVMISSVQGLIAIPERSSYSASKHALQAFSDSLRAEVAADNVHVTVVSAGYIKTQLSLNALTESGEKYAKMDANTESGYSAEHVARKVLDAVVQGKKEIVVASLTAKVAIQLRKYLPSVYFYVMSYRAKKGMKG